MTCWSSAVDLSNKCTARPVGATPGKRTSWQAFAGVLLWEGLEV